MKDRLVIFLKSQGLTSSKLAELIGVQPSGISHIISGRNKPGYDFLVKLMKVFPELSPDWLLLGSGNMYRDDNRTLHNDESISASDIRDAPRKTTTVEQTLFEPRMMTKQVSNASKQSRQPEMHDDNNSNHETSISHNPSFPIIDQDSNNISQIIVCYNDKTFYIYRPK